MNTTHTNTPTLTPITTPIKLQSQNFLPLPLSVTELPLTPFDITTTHSPPPHPHIPDPSDIDPILLRNINKPHSRKSILVPTPIKGRRRHSQFDPSLHLPKPCIHSQPEPSLPPPKPSTILVLDSFDTLREQYSLSDVDSITFFLFILVFILLITLLNIPLPL